jgi:hypothetical protein
MSRFFSFRWWVELLPVIARRTLGGAPAARQEDGLRAQNYLDFLRENGPVPGPAPGLDTQEAA